MKITLPMMFFYRFAPFEEETRLTKGFAMLYSIFKRIII